MRFVNALVVYSFSKTTGREAHGVAFFSFLAITSVIAAIALVHGLVADVSTNTNFH